MTTINRSIYTLFSALVILAGAHLAQAANEPTNLVATVDVPEGLSLEDISEVIVKKAIARQWLIKDKSDDTVIINLVHRGWDSTLTLVYDQKQVKIYSDSWVLDKKGNKKKRKEPAGWIKNIKNDVAVGLSEKRFG